MRGRRLITVLALVVVAVGAFAAWRWLDRPAATELTAPDVAGAVILIPGYGGGAGGLSGLASALQSQGRTVVIADIGDGYGDIASYGSSVAALASSLIREGAPSVDLVGYSMGGLIARSAAAANPGAVRRVATVGSPHKGTRLAGLGSFVGSDATCPTACQQMAPGSEFLDALPVAADASRWLSAWSASDEVVQPADSGALDGATNVEVIQACGAGPLDHGAVVRAPENVDLVTGFLATGTVTAACGG
jgi:pimeloyl-ACP methyl ester carboxylesterase